MNMGENKEIQIQTDRVQLFLDPNLSYDEWVAVGKKLVDTTQNIMWWLGDWWNYGEHKYGEMASQALELGIAYQTFSNAAYVASRIEPARRLPNVSWSHHKEVAPLDPQKQDTLLNDSAVRGYTVRNLKSEIKKMKMLELDSGEQDIFERMEEAGINIKYTSFWSFGKPNNSFGLDIETKTPPQMIANLLFWYAEPGNFIVDLTDSYGTTRDLCRDLFGYECATFTPMTMAYPGLEGVERLNVIFDAYPKEVNNADVVILNMLDFLDEYDDSEVAGQVIRHQLSNLGVATKNGSKLILITTPIQDMFLENIFELVYEEYDYEVRNIINTQNKTVYTREEELDAIENKKLLEKSAHIVILENITE